MSLIHNDEREDKQNEQEMSFIARGHTNLQTEYLPSEKKHKVVQSQESRHDDSLNLNEHNTPSRVSEQQTKV